MRTRHDDPSSWITADVGFAADRTGAGLAYAEVQGRGQKRLLRIPFRVGPARSGDGSDRVVGYTAMAAVARALRRWQVRRVRVAIDDSALVADLGGQRDVPSSLVMPYVRLRCALNQFDEVDIVEATENDLTQRARAEVAFTIAA